MGGIRSAGRFSPYNPADLAGRGGWASRANAAAAADESDSARRIWASGAGGVGSASDRSPARQTPIARERAASSSCGVIAQALMAPGGAADFGVLAVLASRSVRRTTPTGLAAPRAGNR